MGCELIKAIREQTEVLFCNANIMLQTCNLDFVLCDMPIWKHVYHMFHSCDQWYINPEHYHEPDYHEPGLNSLDKKSERVLSKEDLVQYLEKTRTKILAYLDSLTDDMLYKTPPDCRYTRLTLILLQIRHFYVHLGNINATTIIETNKWPRVIGANGRNDASDGGFYE